jgi:pyrroloquinoline quinone biosynthesis protein B
MGHLPQSGHDGMLAWLKTVERPRKMLIHINNTNPILIEDSPERAEVEAQGVEVAIDGLEFEVQMMGSLLEAEDISRDVAP